MSNVLGQFLRELGFVLFEHKGGGLFGLLSPPPGWLIELWGLVPTISQAPLAEKSPFLESFLIEADQHWNSGGSGMLRSEAWIEKAPSGKELPLEAIALQLEGKRFLGLASSALQFEERTNLLQAARQSLLDHEKLQREIQKKEILLHCIVHDLSQPLSVMSVAFDSIAEERVSDRAKDLLQLGRKASDQQLAMIRDILQVFSADLKASMDSPGRVSSAANILRCAQSVLKAFTPVFSAKNVCLRLDDNIDESAAWWVIGETARLERIFSNLLENAVRYAPPASKVTIGLTQDSEFITACVNDEGPGLPLGLSHSQIFALFAKGKEGGGKAGLGLYFCRLTIERWGGAIGCESLPHRGARFWFRLPKAATKPDDQPQTSEQRSTKKSTSKAGMRVLLAEDQEEIRILTEDQLKRDGHYVVAVANGQQALDALQRKSFDAVLLDEDMPVMTGVQALHKIREQNRASQPRLVIALTGYNSEPDRARLLIAGFDAVLAKPFRLDALSAVLQGEAPKRPEKPETVPAQSPVASLIERVGGDEALARKMVGTFLRDTPKRVASMEKALKKQDAVAVASLAHAIKGSVSIFGADTARDCSARIQDSARATNLSQVPAVLASLKEEIANLERNLRGYAGQQPTRTLGATSKIKRRNSTPDRKSR